MARKRISEFRTKTLLYQEFGILYTGQVATSKLQPKLDLRKRYVIKVDQGIKGRFKKGLVGLNQSPGGVQKTIQELSKKGYDQFIIEDYLFYNESLEKYLSIDRIRGGYRLLYSEKGGVNVEKKERPIDEYIIPDDHQLGSVAEKAGIQKDVLRTLLAAFDRYYFSFLEINPFIIFNDRFSPLDAAAEVDSAGEFFVKNAWTEEDFRIGKTKEKTEEEKAVAALSAKSPSAFSLEMLNPEGSIFVLLLGGGASIVLADEVYNQGSGKELANYGEASGNPNAEEVYLYAKNILQLLLKSKAKKKVFIIAGGVANFSDVRVLFRGVITALAEVADQLRKEDIQIFVRRGGPFQKEGLTQMKQFLEKEELLGVVEGPEMVLTDIITKALEARS